MDLQKEREAFEDWYCKNHTGLKQSDLAKFRTLSDYSFSDSLKINISWEAWQAAKAQADQKIKLLLCDEHLKKCESPTGIFNSQYPDEEPCLICLAKEAKANTVQEGFVLVEKTDLECAIDALKWASNEDSDLCAKQAGVLEDVLKAQEPAND